MGRRTDHAASLETVNIHDCHPSPKPKQCENETLLYDPRKDPYHSDFDESLSDHHRHLPDWESPLHRRFYAAMTLILRWLPFLIFTDCVIGLLWVFEDRYLLNQWGILRWAWHYERQWYYQSILGYVAVCAVFWALLRRMRAQNTHSDEEILHAMNNAKTSNVSERNVSETLFSVHALYPTTTRVIEAQDKNRAGVLLIGTSHLSPDSAEQVGQLIAAVEPEAVVLELDEDRYIRMRLGDMNPNLYRGALARDLLWPRTYLDPISLFARIGTGLTAYFVEPGMEFRKAANEAIRMGKEIVYGDQTLEKTVASIQDNTPLWLVVALNGFIVFSYGMPIVAAMMHLFAVVQKDSWTNLGTKLAVSTMLWNVMYYPAWLIIRVFTEQSKMKKGMKRIVVFLKLLGTLMPFLRNIFQASDIKDVRDRTLIERTMDAARRHGKGKVVVTVIGLAHMQSMADIAAGMDSDLC